MELTNQKLFSKNVVFFVIGQGVSMMGAMIVVYAIIWHITLETKSGAILAVLSVASTLPAIFLGPLSGVLSDRYNRRSVAMCADSAVALITVVMAVLLIFNNSIIFLVIEIVVLRSVSQGFQQPITMAIIPQITPEKHLVRINGIMDTIMSAITFASPPLAALFLSLMPLNSILFISAFTSFVGVAIMFFIIKVPNTEKMNEQTSQTIKFWTDFKNGLKYVKKSAILFRMMIIMFIISFCIEPAAMLIPLQITRKFGENTFYLSVNEMAFSFGMLLGGVLISTWGGFKKLSLTFSIACAGISLTCIGLGIAPHVILFFISMGVCGFFIPLFNTPGMTMMMKSSDENHMGRVMSVSTVLQGVSAPIAAAFFGPLADVVSIDLIMVLSASPILLIAAYCLSSKILGQVRSE